MLLEYFYIIEKKKVSREKMERKPTAEYTIIRQNTEKSTQFDATFSDMTENQNLMLPFERNRRNHLNSITWNGIELKRITLVNDHIM